MDGVRDVVVITAHRDDGVCLGGKGGRGIELVAGKDVARELSAELAAVIDEHLREGADCAVLFLLPGDGEDGIVKVIADGTAGEKSAVGAPVGLLTVYQIPRCVRLQKRRDDCGVARLAVA